MDRFLGTAKWGPVLAMTALSCAVGCTGGSAGGMLDATSGGAAQTSTEGGVETSADTGTSTGVPDPTMAGEALIGPEGGTIEADGVSLTVPPGALAEPVLITLEAMPQDSTSGMSFAAMTTLEPSGLTFAVPYTLSFDAPAPGSGEQLVVALQSQDGSIDALIPEAAGERYQIEGTHFSGFFRWITSPIEVLRATLGLSIIIAEKTFQAFVATFGLARAATYVTACVVTGVGVGAGSTCCPVFSTPGSLETICLSPNTACVEGTCEPSCGDPGEQCCVDTKTPCFAPLGDSEEYDCFLDDEAAPNGHIDGEVGTCSASCPSEPELTGDCTGPDDTFCFSNNQAVVPCRLLTAEESSTGCPVVSPDFRNATICDPSDTCVEIGGTASCVTP